MVCKGLMSLDAENVICRFLYIIIIKFLLILVEITMVLCDCDQGRSKRSGWSGFGRTTISQGKNKVPFYKK